MARLWARTSNFESINIGDQLPILVKWDTRESIEQFNAQAPLQVQVQRSPREDKSGESGVLEVPAAKLTAYVVELLEKAFPPESITAPGSQIRTEHVAPALENDVISFSGSVVNKREEAGLKLVECQVRVENEQEQVVAGVTVTVSF